MVAGSKSLFCQGGGSDGIGWELLVEEENRMQYTAGRTILSNVYITLIYCGTIQTVGCCCKEMDGCGISLVAGRFPEVVAEPVGMRNEK